MTKNDSPTMLRGPLLCALLLSLGCGDAMVDGPVEASTKLTDDKGKTGGEDQKKTPGLLFSGSGETTGPRVELEPSKTGDQTFTVRVLLRDFTNLYGVAGHLRYDPAALQLTKVDKHVLLDGGNSYLSRTIAADSPKGRILLGVSRFRVAGSPYSGLAGVDVSKQVWVTLYFKVLKDGDSALAFDPDTTLVKDAAYAEVKTSFGGLTIQAQEVSQ